MQQFTRINGHTIPRVDWQTWNYPVFSPAHCTAHLSHEEWLETLSPDVLWRLSLHHDDEYISNLDSAGRFYFSCGVRLQDSKDMFGYIDQVSQAMKELGESMGMEWVGTRGSYYPHDVLIASFRCPNGGSDRIVTIFADGTKLFTDVAPGFAHEGFNDFANDILNELMQSIGNNNASVVRLRAFFEERYEQLFPSLHN